MPGPVPGARDTVKPKMGPHRVFSLGGKILTRHTNKQ